MEAGQTRLGLAFVEGGEQRLALLLDHLLASIEVVLVQSVACASEAELYETPGHFFVLKETAKNGSEKGFRPKKG